MVTPTPPPRNARRRVRVRAVRHDAFGSTDAADQVRRLIDRYRTQCLWFLRRGYYPTTDAARERVLRQIERHGDLHAFRRAAEIRTWLSHRSSGTSADCWRTAAAAPATATAPEASH